VYRSLGKPPQVLGVIAVYCERRSMRPEVHHPARIELEPARKARLRENISKAIPMIDASPARYFLKSARLGFRCWRQDDLALAHELWGDIEVTRFFGGPFSAEQIVARFHRELGRLEEHGFQYWAIHLLSDNDFVGCCGLRPYRPLEEIHELGFHLRPKYWGQGLAVEAARAAIAYAFQTVGAKGLSAGHHPGNVNSKKVIEKLGFRYSHDEHFPAVGMDIPYYLLWAIDRTSAT
jgi:[ribosomal protein S5]-alanine N-acetyltransferase